MKKQMPLWPVAAVAIVIVAVVGYFLLIRPKRAEAGRLADKIAELETQVRTAKLAARPDEAGEKLRVAPLFELTKAMPGRDDVPGIILELNSIAEATGVRFKAIAPQNPVSQEGYRALPITLTFQGNYYDLTDFLFRVRNLVSVRDGKLAASGRFLTLDTLDMRDAGLPQIEAILTISAYVYDPNSHSTAPVAPVSGTTVGTTTAPTTTEPLGSAAPGVP